jgi:methionine-gamma-lyase
VSTSLVDRADPEAFEKALTPQTRLVLVEAPSNPLRQITDLRAVAELARAHDVLGALSRPGDPPAARAGSQS